MATRLYLCELVGTGTVADQFRPAIAEYETSQWQAVDGRGDATKKEGLMLVRAEINDNQHAMAMQDPKITFINPGNVDKVLLLVKTGVDVQNDAEKEIAEKFLRNSKGVR